MKKICKCCNMELKITKFPNRKTNKDGLHIYCKNCIRHKHIIYDKKIGYKRKKERYHLDPTFRERCIKWSTRPLGSRNEYLKEYYRNNKERMNNNSRKYCRKNRSKINKWYREYYKNPSKRIARNMYNRIRIAIYNQLAKKSQKTKLLCGCSWEELIKHLEKQFKDGMSWNNYGRNVNNWSIDHIIPCDKFNLIDPKEQKKCFHYTNLRPLWSTENSSKRNN